MEPNQPFQTPNTPPELPSQPVYTQPSSSSSSKFPIFLLALIALVSICGLIYFYFQNQTLRNQLTTQHSASPIPISEQITQPSPTTDPTTNWQTYTNVQYKISFKYPPEYEVSEPGNGFIIIKKPNDAVAQAGISIETRLSGSYKTYQGAQEYFQTSFNNSETKKIGIWEVFQGSGKEGMLKGVEFRSAITEYKGGALKIETLTTSEYTKYFDQILSTFKFTDTQ